MVIGYVPAGVAVVTGGGPDELLPPLQPYIAAALISSNPNHASVR